MKNNLIVHTADIHIRNEVRVQEYKKVFSKTLKALEKLQPKCFVIAGDIVHSKLRLFPETFRMAKQFITQASQYTKVVIIPGNHDININNKEKLDVISVITEDFIDENNNNVFYYKKSGIYDFDEKISFGVFSMLDEVNDEPIEFERKKDRIYIALYHGMIKGCSNDEGYQFIDGQGLDIFKNYDYVMLGDIHKMQVLNFKEAEKIIDESELEKYKKNGWRFIEYVD